mmetsp:Transcript_12760/g.45190  ORF Transcript_12760/g.45190 Transcript_12760/m.45190 type:complete len:368 (-) Transcript_12760:790-1893(-)
MDDPKALRVAMAPLKVIQQRPSEIATHVGTLDTRRMDSAQVSLEKAASVDVFGDVLHAPLDFSCSLRIQVLRRGARLRLQRAGSVVELDGGGRLEGAAVLSDHDATRRAVSPVDVQNELPEAPRHDRPAHVGFLPSGVFVPPLDSDVPPIPLAVQGLAELAGEVRAVGVQPEEVAGVPQQLLLLGGELRQPVATSIHHALRIAAEPDRVCEPAQRKVHSLSGGFPVAVRGGIPRLPPIGVQGDAHGASLGRGELLAVDRNSLGMRHQHVVRGDVGLSLGCFISARSVLAAEVPQDSTAPRLVQGDPMLHPRSKEGEASPCIIAERRNNLLLWAEPAPKLLLQSGRHVPMVQRDPRGDAFRQQSIDEV